MTALQGAGTAPPVRPGPAAEWRAVAAAALVAAAAAAALPVPLPVGLGLAAVGGLLRRGVLVVLAVALVVSGRADRAWSAQAVPPPDEWEGLATLGADPRPIGPGVVVEVIAGGRRYEAMAYGGAAGPLRRMLAGERIELRSTVAPLPSDRPDLARRHLAGRMSVEGSGLRLPPAPVHRIANGLRRTLAGGLDHLPDDRRALVTGVVFGDDREQTDADRDAFRAAGLSHLLAVSGVNVRYHGVMRALIYTRVSSDPKGRGRSVGEQEAECRSTCERNGWQVAGVLTDNDRSASRFAKKDRPAWAEVHRQLAAGAADVLVTWEASRAQRDLRAFVDLRDVCRAHGVLWSYSGRIVDLDDPNDSTAAGLDALLAEREAEDTRRRVRRAMAANASTGRPHGRRMFGYRRVYDDRSGALIGQEPEPAEADLIREAARRVLAGESVRAIAADWNDRGATTTTGGAWSPSTVRRMLVNPHYAARRVHQGKVVGAADWPAILTDDEFDRLVAILTDPSRRSTRRRERTHLLTGIARCGRCGGPMMVGKDRGGRKVYTCRVNQHLTIGADATEEFVTAVVVARLARPDALAELEDGAPDDVVAARAEVDELRAQLDEAADRFVAGDLSAAMLARVETRIMERIADAERRTRFAAMPTTGRDLAEADDVAAAWEALTVEQRVELVRALLDVTILPSARQRGVKGFDPDRVRIDWRSC